MKKSIIISLGIVALLVGVRLHNLYSQSISFPGPGIGTSSGACPCNGFGHNRQITLNPNSNLVPSTQTNFAVLIVPTSPTYLALVASGGQIVNTASLNGYTVPTDLSFTSDSGCNTALHWEVLPGYVTTTGAIQVFVNIASLGTAAQNIWMCYGKAGNTTYQGSSTSTWTDDGSYKGVWHMQDNLTSTVIAESSGGTNATNIVNTSTKTTAAQFGNGLAYNGTSDASSVALNLSAVSGVSVSCWLNWTTFGSNDKLLSEFGTNGLSVAGDFVLDPNWSGSANFEVSMSNSGSRRGDTFARPTAAAWHFYTFVMDRATPVNTVYVDGALKTLTTETHGTVTGNFANATLNIMSRTINSLFGAGTLQEYRLSNALRSQDWHTTNFNNHNSPSSFISVGAEN